MPTGHLDTDYLILGAGAMGMACEPNVVMS
jgi:hypothetical protein